MPRQLRRNPLVYSGLRLSLLVLPDDHLRGESVWELDSDWL
jgi:hypothetical protein